MTVDKRVCIVGAGPSGLATARVLLADGFDPEIYEKASSLGGSWHPDRTYPTLRTNDPREFYRFSDFPYPEGVDDYPTAEQVLAYLEGYAEHHDLLPRIRFSTEVRAIERLSNGENGRFEVELQAVDNPDEAGRRRYDHVAVCNGVFSEPHIPDIPGVDRFAGEVLHSSELNRREQIEDQRVVVVGGAKSAHDCASLAADHARSSTMLFRSPHWLAPRWMYGLRVDWLILTRWFQAFLPYHTTRGLRSLLHGPGRPLVDLFWKFQTWSVRKLANMPAEMVPDEPLPEGFRYIGTGVGIYDKVRDGRIATQRGEIAAFADGETLELDTGQTLPADVIVFATGWKQPLDFLAPDLRELVRDDDGLFTLYRHILPPGAPHIGFIGYASSIGNMLMSEVCAHWLAAAFQGELDLPDRDIMYAEIHEARAWAEEAFTGAIDGHLVGPYFIDFTDQLLRDMGVTTRRADNLVAEYFGRCHAERYVGIGEERRGGPGSRLNRVGGT